MPILDQDFYTGYNTVKDVAQSVAVGREVDRKANLMGSLGDLYKTNPQPTLEDLRAQYAVHGTPEDLARIDDKIYTRDLTKASTKFQNYQTQLQYAKQTNDLKAQKAIADNMNLDPDVSKFIGNIQSTPTGEFTFTAMQRMKYPNPANPSEIIDVQPNDVYKMNASGELTHMNPQNRISLQQTQTKAANNNVSNKPALKGVQDDSLLRIYNRIAQAVQTEDPSKIPALIAAIKSEPRYIAIANAKPGEVAALNQAIQKLGFNLSGVNTTVAFTGKK